MAPPTAAAGLLLAGGQALVDGALRRADVHLVDGRIAAVDDDLEPAGSPDVLDCRNRIVAPGFIDLQCNGAAGHDLTGDPRSVGEVGRALVRHGVTAWLPTIVTAPRRTRDAALDAIDAMDAMDTMDALQHEPASSDTVGARPLGLHLEGPALNPAHAGAHDTRHLGLPADDEVDAWIDRGIVRMVTLAPELPGAPALVARLSSAGIVVAAGHTAMTPDELRGAVDLGVCYVTHLFNAMSALHHRTPGAVGAALDTPGTVVGLVCDGHHVDAVAVRLAARALGPHRVSLVSDASPALDAPRGTLRLGRHEVTRGDTGPRLADGTLAGSAIGLDEAVRTYREMVGCTVPEALAPVTSTPAALLGLPDRGILAPGAAGDVVVLDESLAVRCTVLGGTVAWRS